MDKDATKKPPATVTDDPQRLKSQIRQRGFELYQERSREDGHELDDWLIAEEEILQARKLESPPDYRRNVLQKHSQLVRSSSR